MFKSRSALNDVETKVDYYCICYYVHLCIIPYYFLDVPKLEAERKKCSTHKDQQYQRTGKHLRIRRDARSRRFRNGHGSQRQTDAKNLGS